MIRNKLTPRDVQAVRYLAVPIILAAAFGDGLALLLLLAKLLGATFSWGLVLLPVVCGLAFMAGMVYRGWRTIKAEREIDRWDERFQKSILGDRGAALEDSETEDHEATRN